MHPFSCSGVPLEFEAADEFGAEVRQDLDDRTDLWGYAALGQVEFAQAVLASDQDVDAQAHVTGSERHTLGAEAVTLDGCVRGRRTGPRQRRGKIDAR